jgi:hypothetical protein
MVDSAENDFSLATFLLYYKLGAMSSNNPQPASQSTTRLHIFPLSPDLFKILLPPSKLPSYSNLSYHSVETSPDQTYAFLDVPSNLVDKLQKQLSGTFIRGKTLKISKAKPEIWREYSVDAPTDKSSSISRDHPVERLSVQRLNILEGYRIPDTRRIQRGWATVATASNSARDVSNSFTMSKPNAECLFRVSLPQNASGKDTTKGSRKQVLPGGRYKHAAVLREHTNATKFSSFLRSEKLPADLKPVSEYIEGTGWVDLGGKVVEPEPQKNRLTERALAFKPSSPEISEVSTPDHSDSSSGSEHESSSNSNGNSSDATNDTVSEAETKDEVDDISINYSEDLDILVEGKETRPSVPTEEKAVHPLEAVFKPTSNTLTIADPIIDKPETFTFFGSDADSLVDEDQDADYVDEEMDDAPTINSESRVTGKTKDPGIVFDSESISQSDWKPYDPLVFLQTVVKSIPKDVVQLETKKPFAETFYENRSTTNRVWKQRRKEARKLQRKLDNRRKEKRVV